MITPAQLLRLAPLLLALGAGDVLAVDVIVSGPPGSKGQNATAGANGTAGTAAPVQTYSIGSVDNAISLTVSSGTGGQGGDGLAADGTHPQRVPGAGAGGGASTATLGAAPATGPGNATLTVTGGHGGDAGAVDPLDTLTLGASGGNGGSAVGNLNASASSPAAVAASASAAGGNGGTGTGVSYSGGAGGGGGVTLSAWSVSGPFTGSGSVDASASAIGGNGGVGLNLANGGQGGDAAVQSFSARSSGLLALTQAATGGNGGDSFGSVGGNGGVANTNLNYFSFNPVGGIGASITATGGNGGNGQDLTVFPGNNTFFGTGGSGGNARSVLELQSAHPAAGVTGTSVSGSAAAYGGASGGAFGDTGLGGDAYSQATVRSYGMVSSTSLAVGGQGGGRFSGAPGNATAMASAYSNESANSRATANGGSGARFLDLGSASASAYAEVARTQADAAPPGGLAIASAFAMGGSIAAAARSSASDEVLQASAQSSTISNLAGGGIGIAAYSSANVGGLAYAAPAAGFPGGVSYASAQPTSASARAALTAAPAVAAALAGAPIVGTGGQESLFSSYIASSEFHLVNTIGTHLLIGFLLTPMDNRRFDSLDFSIRNFNTTLVSRSFTSLAAAVSFFDDKVLDLGLLGGPALDLTVSTTLTDASFGFAYAIAAAPTAVPEGNIWTMLIVGLLVMLASVRKGSASDPFMGTSKNLLCSPLSRIRCSAYPGMPPLPNAISGLLATVFRGPLVLSDLDR
jgi:hypothetical protein